MTANVSFSCSAWEKSFLTGKECECVAAQLKSTFGDSCSMINFMNSIRFGTCKLQVFYFCHSRSALFSINISIFAEF